MKKLLFVLLITSANFSNVIHASNSRAYLVQAISGDGHDVIAVNAKDNDTICKQLIAAFNISRKSTVSLDYQSSKFKRFSQVFDKVEDRNNFDIKSCIKIVRKEYPHLSNIQVNSRFGSDPYPGENLITYTSSEDNL